MQASREPLILSVNTVTPLGSVALVRGENVVVSRTDAARLAHSATLLAQIDALLEAASTMLREVELFAAMVGPGSFTGVRTGLATVKAFAATLARPTIGVPTLHAMARAAGPVSRSVALLPAGRGEVFAQFLAVTNSGRVEELDGAWHVGPEILFERCRRLGSPLKWVGANPAHSQMIREYAHLHSIAFNDQGDNEEVEAEDGWTVISPPQPAALAEQAAALALAAYRAGRAVSAEALRAIYVRPSDAELNER